MVDKIKPLKIENSSTGGTEIDPFPREANPTQDYISTKGLAIEGLDDIRIDLENNQAGYSDFNSNGFIPFNKFNEVNETLKVGEVSIYGSYIVLQSFDNLFVTSDSDIEDISYISFEEC